MIKLINWLTKTILATVLVTSISIATTWAIVNAYVGQVLGQLGVGAAVQPVKLADVFTALLSPPAAGEPETAPTAAAPQADSWEAPDPVPDDQALPVMGQALEQSSAQRDELVLSAEDLNTRKDQMTEKERTEIFSMLISKLPPEEMQKLSMLLEGGIREDEIQQASDILRRYLTEEEYEKLVSILLK